MEILEIFLRMKKNKNSYKPVTVSNFWSNSYIEYQSNSDRNKTILVDDEYLHKIRPYLKNIINNLKKSDTWKTQLTKSNSFISSIENDEERVMHSKSDNIEIMINKEESEVTEKPFNALKNGYQNNLKPMRGSKFVFNYVHLLYYKCHKINPNRGEFS